MKVLITGGGTGGHIYPALAIADKIKEHRPDTEFIYVGTLKGMENDIVPAHGYEFRAIHASGFHRRHLVKNVKTLGDTLTGAREAGKIIREFKPDIAIGTGGYVCVPMLKAAAKAGVKCYIHEQNAFPGMANRSLEIGMEKVLLGFADAAEYFREPEKLVVVGNPVRSAFLGVRKEAARQELGIGQDEFVLLSFGGSLGAGRINKAMISVSSHFGGAEKMQVYFGTGRKYYDPIKGHLEEQGISFADNIHMLEYINNMDRLLVAADLVVSRSGALTLAELTTCGTPSILIPSPNVTGNHQYFNAKAVADRGGAVIIEEKDLTDELLISQISRLKDAPDQLAEMRRCARECAPGDAAQKIYEELELPL